MGEPCEPLVLIAADDPERKPKLFACRKCGSLHSPAIYAVRGEIALETARNAALSCYNCMTDRACDDCGGLTGSRHYTACEACRWKRKLAKCERIDAATVGDCFAVDGDTMYGSPEEAAEDGHEWVHPALPLRTFAIDMEALIDRVLDDHFEDASTHDLRGLRELQSAVEAFNKAQTSGTYDIDTKRIANIAHLIPPPEPPAQTEGEG